jgi:hypothetical protein
MNQDGKRKPTNRNSQFVASDGARSRAARQLLAGLWRSVRRQLPVPDGTGDISLWVCQLSGLGGVGLNGQSIEADESHIEAEAALRALGPEASPEKISDKFTTANALKVGPYYQDMIAAASGKDFATFDTAFTELAKQVGNLWVPGFRPPFPVSFDAAVQMSRAVRVTSVCTVLQKVHPLTLIARALNGDQEAVVDLVRADKLFLMDRCTQNVIRDAGLRNDQPFMGRLASAQKYQPRLRRRDLIHIYLYLLFLLELAGQPLPRIDELQRLVDPEGREFEGIYAFERNLQRQRELWTQMWTEALSELPALLSYYESAHPSPR